MNIKPKSGSLLIAEPFMKDPNFKRAVVLLCEHHEKGSFGLVFNRPLEANLSQVLPEMEEETTAFDIPLYYGGPCEQNTLHFVHTIPDLPQAEKIHEGLYWGGDFNDLKDRIRLGEIEDNMIRFFVGYSGWSESQLEEELKRSDWIVDDIQKVKILFEDDPFILWQEVLKNKGGNYKMMSNFPVDPRLN